MPVEIFTARKGEGISLSAVAFTYRQYLGGKTVFSNYKLDFLSYPLCPEGFLQDMKILGEEG